MRKKPALVCHCSGLHKLVCDPQQHSLPRLTLRCVCALPVWHRESCSYCAVPLAVEGGAVSATTLAGTRGPASPIASPCHLRAHHPPRMTCPAAMTPLVALQFFDARTESPSTSIFISNRGIEPPVTTLPPSATFSTSSAAPALPAALPTPLLLSAPPARAGAPPGALNGTSGTGAPVSPVIAAGGDVGSVPRAAATSSSTANRPSLGARPALGTGAASGAVPGGPVASSVGAFAVHRGDGGGLNATAAGPDGRSVAMRGIGVTPVNATAVGAAHDDRDDDLAHAGSPYSTLRIHAVSAVGSSPPGSGTVVSGIVSWHALRRCVDVTGAV